MIDNFIQLLTKELELEGSLATQVPGVYALPIEENIALTMTDHPPGFSLSCTLGSAKKQNEEAFYTRLLLGNLFGQGTKGSVLGLSEDGNQLTLTQTIDYDVEYKEFRDILEDFMNSVDYWVEESKIYR